jgi:hypothetical protein
MPTTPDRAPGPSKEERTDYDVQTGASTDGEGQVLYSDGGFKMRDSAGEFDPRTGGGLSEAQHEALDTLVHAIAETSYLEVTRSGGFVTDVVIWTDSGKTKKVRELTNIVRTGGRIDSYDLIQYDGAGAVKQTVSYAVTRTAGRISSIQMTES